MQCYLKLTLELIPSTNFSSIPIPDRVCSSSFNISSFLTPSCMKKQFWSETCYNPSTQQIHTISRVSKDNSTQIFSLETMYHTSTNSCTDYPGPCLPQGRKSVLLVTQHTVPHKHAGYTQHYIRTLETMHS